MDRKDIKVMYDELSATLAVAETEIERLDDVYAEATTAIERAELAGGDGNLALRAEASAHHSRVMRLRALSEEVAELQARYDSD